MPPSCCLLSSLFSTAVPLPAATSFIKFDAGTLHAAAFKTGYVFAAYNCTNMTAPGEASTALEFDIMVRCIYNTSVAGCGAVLYVHSC
jgi:hypothetical protein